MTPTDESDSISVDANVAASQTLGFVRAEQIVCKAANAVPQDLSRTLNDLGIDGKSFQGTVFNGICAAGYTFDIDSIPDGKADTLLAVVAAIQDATLATK